MVDAEPGYRPRRAFIEPEPPSAAPDPEPDDDSAEDERPKPLYRDQVADPAPTPVDDPAPVAAPGPAAAPEATGHRDSTTRPITFAPRRPRVADDEATRILPRTPPGRRAGSARVDIDDLDSDDEHRPMNSRARTALLIGGVAAVVVIGLAVIYAVAGVGNTPQTTPTPSPVVSSGSSSPSSVLPTATVVLDGASLVTTAEAGRVVPERTWTVASTDSGSSPDTPQAACVGSAPAEGQPTPQQRMTRVLSSSGKDAPGLLHEATAYATPEEAIQAYAVAARTLGGCPVTGSYVVSGQAVSGFGDQSLGVVVAALDGVKTQVHTVVLSRTGRVLNLLDATQPSQAISTRNVAQAAAAVTSRECSAAGGRCAGQVAVADGPPPLGGDEPGFLAFGDLPPAAKAPTLAWIAAPPEPPKADFEGSQCETVNWSTLSSGSANSRIYLLSDSGSVFGLNDIVVTLTDANAAQKLVDRIESDLTSCENRQLTATVSKPEKVASIGARKTPVTGWTADVSQKSTKGDKKYRVGIVAAGRKVAYTFLNPQDGLDVTDAQWRTVALRAGERTTQIN